jgi:hypothetical protein
LLWALAGLAVAAPSATLVEQEGPYERALQRALEQAQAGLIAEIEVWRDHSTWPDAWVVRSEHYELRTTHSRALGVQLTQGLEAMFGHFQTVLGTDYEPDQPFRVDVFPTLQEYNQFGEDFGAEHSSFYGSFHAAGQAENQVATYYVPNHTQLGMWVTHGALHQFLRAAFPTLPPTWIEEGLASYFALYWDPGYGVREIDRIRGANGPSSFIPLEQLMGASAAEYTTNPHTRLMQLGMLFTYLLHHCEDTRTRVEGDTVVSSPFADYLRVVLSGADPAQNDLHGLFTVDLEMLENDFEGFEFPR